ncbi:CRTAC1 family protein [Alteromonas sp. KUL49]|uniref:CRTAC1 family protein n=1 Tax=Alteromonas sp. KUL49 TaxID=2480798 RepID=UPI00102F0321|nr:CRTAC1 family protein [Alteromonas sp. KUL49]TAP34493.1 CRTAC1 family protein [Alteromonas sp. KUL49]GEA13543.1 hypothetical protein KUL49_39180 [Alteromonas sp. KUL49]
MNIQTKSSAILLLLSGLAVSCAQTNDSLSVEPSSAVSFVDVSAQVELVTESNWKYGGPSVSDIDGNGRYDFLLTNHDTTPVQLFMANENNTYTEITNIYPRVDLHGISAGDYDGDGDNDVLLSLGGGNGLTPQPQRLLRNDDGSFTDVTQEAGIGDLGARGRSVRWVDIDNDGDLDFMQVNAAKMVKESQPRNILFENNGNGTFRYVPSPAFEDIEAERVLITDFNNDHVLDIIAFTSYDKTTVWQGNGDFTFTDVTQKVLPSDSNGYEGTITVAQADIDNDGDLDYYLARGKLYYTIANNAVSFDEEKGRLDLRDQGSKSHDGITLFAEGELLLSDFYHFPRANLLEFMPVFLGADKKQVVTPSEALAVAQTDAKGFPELVDKTGWYLGYMGNNKWRFEWMLEDNLAWDIRASIHGVSRYQAPWTPQVLSVPDVLLRNDNGVLVDVSHRLPEASNTNTWGVTTGDFDNNGYEDFFVYRFGELKARVADLMLLNTGEGGFEVMTEHGATSEIGQDSHGDGGVAFDYNQDGKVDILSGDDDNGKWHLYENQTQSSNNYVQINVGYSPKGTDPYGAKIWVITDTETHYKLIGSSSANHSQSLLNLTHFGTGQETHITKVHVRWRDGYEQTLTELSINQTLSVGEKPAS